MDITFENDSEDTPMSSDSSSTQSMDVDQSSPVVMRSVEDVAMLDESGERQVEGSSKTDVDMSYQGNEDENRMSSSYKLPFSLYKTCGDSPQLFPSPTLESAKDFNHVAQTSHSFERGPDAEVLGGIVTKTKLDSPLLHRSRMANGTVTSGDDAAIQRFVEAFGNIKLDEPSSAVQADDRQHLKDNASATVPQTFHTDLPPWHDPLPGLKAKVSSSNHDLRARLSSLRQPNFLKQHTSCGYAGSDEAGPSRLPQNTSRRTTRLAERMRVGSPRTRPSLLATTRDSGIRKLPREHQQRETVQRLIGDGKGKQPMEVDDDGPWLNDSDQTMVDSSDDTAHASLSSMDMNDEIMPDDPVSKSEPILDGLKCSSLLTNRDQRTEVSSPGSHDEANTSRLSIATHEPVRGIYPVRGEACHYDKVQGQSKPHICMTKLPCKLSSGSLLRTATGKLVFVGNPKSVTKPSLVVTPTASGSPNGNGIRAATTTNLIRSPMGKYVLVPRHSSGAALVPGRHQPNRRFSAPALMTQSIRTMSEPSPSHTTALGHVTRGPGSTIQKLFPRGTSLENMEYYVPPSSQATGRAQPPRIVLSAVDGQTIEDEEEIHARGGTKLRGEPQYRLGNIEIVGRAVRWGGVMVHRGKP